MNNIKDKIAKLLALAESPNENEAQEETDIRDMQKVYRGRLKVVK